MFRIQAEIFNCLAGLKSLLGRGLILSLIWMLGAAQASAQVPTFTQEFTPATINTGQNSTIRFTFTNPAATGGVSSLNLPGTLPAGLTVSGAGTTTCAGTSPGNVNAPTGGTSYQVSALGFDFAGFNVLDAGESCIAEIPVVANAVGTVTSTSGDLTYSSTSQGNSQNAGTATGTLTVAGPLIGAPYLTREFLTDPIAVSAGSVQVRYNIQSGERSATTTNITLSDNITNTVALAGAMSAGSNTCGGSFSVTGGNTFVLTGASLAPEASCSFVGTVDISGVAAGDYAGSTGPATGDVSGATVTSNLAYSTIQILQDAAPSMTMSFTDTAAGSATTGTITFTNLAANALTNGEFTIPVSPPLPNSTTITFPATPCGPGSSVSRIFPSTGAESIRFTGGSLAASASCTFSFDITIPSGYPAGAETFSSDEPTGTISGATLSGAPTSATFTVGSGQSASFSKSFSGDTSPGGTVDLTFEITAAGDNTAAMTGLAFTDDVNAMLSGVTGQSGTATDTCGGTLTGSSTLSYSGGSLAAGASCAITVTLDIPAAAASGTYTNTTSELTDTAGGTYGTASSSLSVSSIAIGLEFTDDPVIAGAVATLVFTLENQSASAATSASFTYKMSSPSGLVSNGTPASSCGGSFSGTTFLVLSGGTIPASGSCTITVDVDVSTSVASGTYSTSTSQLSAVVNGSSIAAPAASGALVVETATLLVSETFDSSTLAGQTVVHSYTIENQSGAAATAITLDGDLTTLVSGATFASTGTNSCGFVAGATGGTAISLTGGTLAAGASCNVDLNYAIQAGTAAGSYPYSATNVTGTVGGLAVTGNDSASTLVVAASGAATFTKSFSPTLINVGGSSTLTYTIDNPVGGVGLSNLEFLDNIGGTITGSTVSNLPAAGLCGAGSSLSGTSSLTLTGGILAAGSSCTFSVTVTVDASGAGGSFASATSVLSDNGLTIAAAATSTLNVNVSPPLFSQSIAPASIQQGQSSVVTYTINNAAGTAAVSGISFTDSVPTSATIATTPAAANSCGGAFSAAAGGTGISLSGASIAAGASCTITVPVTSVTVGAATSTSSVLTTAVGNSPAVSGTLTVNSAPAPTFTTVFTPNSIVEGAQSVVSYTINNTASLVDATSLSMTNTLPSGVFFTTSSGASTTCAGGTLSAAPGSSTLTYTGGTIATGATCTISAGVSSIENATYANTTGALTSSQGSSGTASDTLSVTQTPSPLTSLALAPTTVAQGGVSQITYTIDNTAGLIDATNMSFTNAFPGSQNMAVAPTPGVVNGCGGTFTATAAASSVALSGGIVAAGATCTIAVNVRGLKTGVHNNIPTPLVTSFGTGGTFGSAALTVTAAPAPLVTLAFAPSTVLQGEGTRVTLNVDNSGSLVSADTLASSLVFPAGISLAPASNVVSDCAGGSFLSIAGGLSFAANSLAAGASCGFSFNVITADAGNTTMTTADVTSSLGNSGPASGILAITPAAIPTFTKAFDTASMVQGAVSKLTFTINNATALVSASGGAFTDTFPTNMTVAATPNLTSSCSPAGSTPGTFAGAAGAGAVTLSGATVSAGASCTYSVDVTVAASGSFTNTSGAFTSSLRDSAAAVASINITAADVPAFSKAFAPVSVVQGGVSTLTLTINNATALVAASAGGVTDTFPAGMVVAATPNITSSCSNGASVTGTATGATGAAALGISGVTVAAGDTCTYSVDVTAGSVGSFVNTSGDFTSSLGNSGIATATLTTTAAAQPTLAQSLAPSSIARGGVSTLSLVADNSTALVSATAGVIGASFPTGLVIADTPNLTSSCTTAGSVTGTSTGAAGTATYGVSGMTLEAGATCTYTVDVTAANAGALSIPASTFTSSLGGINAAAVTLTITEAPEPTFSKAFGASSIVQGGVTSLTFTIDNTTSFVDATAVGFGDTFPTGMFVATPANAASTCTGGTVTATAGDGTMSYSGGTATTATSCTVSVDVTSSTIGALNNVSDALVSSLNISSAPTAAATLTVTAAPILGLAKTYTPNTVAQGATTTATYVIDNTAALINGTAVAFSDALPTGAVIATPNGVTNTCGGALVAAAGGTSVALTAAGILAGASCQIEVDIVATEIGSTVNSTSDLTSAEFVTTSGVSASLAVTAAPAIVFTKGFGAATIAQGQTVTLTHTIDNTAALIGADTLAFTESLPAGASIATPTNAATTCTNATLTAVAGASTYQLTAGEVAAGATCTVSVDVTAVNIGTVATTGGDLTSNRAAVTPAQVSFDVTAATGPTFAKAFSPASMSQNGISTLTLTIDNSATFVDAETAAFTDTFPAGMTVAAVPNLSTTCTGGTLSGAAGGASVGYSGGTIAATAICVVQVDVTSNTVGAANNVTGDLTTSLGNSGTASATLTVQAATAPVFTNAFSPAQIVPGGTTTLVFTISNAANFVQVGSVGFSATLPAGLTVSNSGFSTTCGGSVSAATGSGAISLSGGTVASGSSCTVSVPVTAPNLGTLGAVSGALTSQFGGSSLSSGGSAPLVVAADPEGRVTFIQQSPTDATFSFASSAAALNFAITTSGGTGSSGQLSVLAGTYTITQTRPSGFGNTTLSCSDNDSTVDVSNGVVTLRLAALENVTCTFNSGNSAQLASETVNSFLNRRNNLILSNGPTRARRLSRLNQGIGTSETLSFQTGDLKSMSPVNFNLLSIGSGNYSLSTSLSQVERAGTMFALAHDGDDDYTTTLKNRRFDVWFEAHYSKFSASQGSGGHFGIAYFGADYLITNDVLAGFMLQFDSLEDITPTTSVDGTGWMAGPYVTARLAPNLIFDGRLAYGQSNNDLRTSLSSGNFDTDRWLVDVNLSGNFDYKDWVISPNLNISYIEDRQHAFTDSLSVVVPEQTVSLGQIKFGPTFSTSYATTNKMTVQPSFTLNGIYNFGNRSGPLITNNTADETNGFRGRVEAAVKLTNRHGTQVDLGMNYDGIGKSDFESWGLKFGLRIPLQ
jgi:hypothetical protein